MHYRTESSIEQSGIKNVIIKTINYIISTNFNYSKTDENIKGQRTEQEKSTKKYKNVTIKNIVEQ